MLRSSVHKAITELMCWLSPLGRNVHDRCRQRIRTHRPGLHAATGAATGGPPRGGRHGGVATGVVGSLKSQTWKLKDKDKDLLVHTDGRRRTNKKTAKDVSRKRLKPPQDTA